MRACIVRPSSPSLLGLLVVAVGAAACSGPERTRYPGTVAEGTGVDPLAGQAVPDTSLDGPSRDADFPDLLELDPTGDLVHAWLGRITIDGPILPEVVEEEVLEVERPIRLCYDNALRRNALASGDIVLGMRVRWPGEIDDLRVLDNTTGDRGLATCVRNNLEAMRFPGAPRDLESVVRIPFRFSTGALPGKGPEEGTGGGDEEKRNPQESRPADQY